MSLLNFKPSKIYFVTICVIGSFLFLTFSTVLYHQYNEEKRVNRWAQHCYEIMNVTRMLLMDIINMETGVRGYLITGHKNFLQPYEEANLSINNYELQLTEMVKDDNDTKLQIDQIIDEINKFSSLLKAQIDLRHTQGKSSVLQASLEAQRKKADHLREALEGFINQDLNILHQQLAIATEKEQEFVYTLIVGAILSVGAMVLVTMMILALAERSRNAEEELRGSEERLLMIMNGVNDGIFDFDLKERTVYYSPEYKAMLGYSDEEYPNTVEMFKMYIHPDDLESTLEHSTRYRNREIPTYHNIFRLRHKNGSWRWILSRGVGIWDKNGEMIRLIGAHTDITEQKKREEDLKQLNNDLESFTYITSHDLRSPLVNLKGFSNEMELALEHAAPVLEKATYYLSAEEKEILHESFYKEIPEALSFIKKSVEKMDMLTNAVLNLSRIGKREFSFQLTDTRSIVKRCLDSMAYEIGQKEAEIICGDLPEIYSDPLALEQIFGNLLDNAVKYLSPQRKGEIIISSQTIGKDIIFSIQDNGRGIDQNDRQKIFDIFRRARNTGDVRGVGIGMAYVKATLRRLGGTIWFDSAVNQGTSFYFRINNAIHEVKAA